MNTPIFRFVAFALVAATVACSSDENVPSPTTTAPTAAHTTQPSAVNTAMPIRESGKSTTTVHRWDSGLFNVIIWLRADNNVVAASYGGLYEGPNAFSPKPGGMALLEAGSATQRWRVETATHAFPAAFASDVVVVGTGNGTVLAFDRTTGAERWRMSFDGIPYQVIAAGNVLVVADGDPETWGPNGLVDKTRLGGRVWGVDPGTGSVLWKKTVGSFNAFIAVDGGLVVASSSSPSVDGETAVFEAATGKELWRKKGESSSPPVIKGDLVVLPNAAMRAFDTRSGQLRWTAEPRNGGTYFFPAIIGDVVVASTNIGTIEVRDPKDGSEIAFAQLGECGGNWFELKGVPYGLVCGGLVRLEHGSTGWSLVRVLQPQGSIDSAAPVGSQIALSTGIGTAPDQVLIIEP